MDYETLKWRLSANPMELYGAVFGSAVLADFILGLFIHLSLFHFWTQFLLGITVLLIGLAGGYLTTRILGLYGISLFQPVSSELVTDGIYSYTRNPMLISLTIIYIGLAILLDVTLAFIALPGLLYYVIYYVVPAEEDRLHDAFDPDYQNYRARVKRWF